MMRPNPLKQRLREGKKCYGTWLLWTYPPACELIAQSGADTVMIDHEHGFGSLSDTLGCLQALSATPTTGLVRIPWMDAVYIKRVLDVGAEGIMVPAVGSAETAREAVAACRYPPRGIRGYGAGVARAADYGLRAADYTATSDDELMIICQIETVAGVEAIPDIAAVDGIDMLFVGPNDLSGDMGRLGQFDDPEVQRTIRQAERAIKDAGKWLGTIPSLGRSLEEMLADGSDLLLCGAESSLLRDAVTDELTAFRKAAGEA